MTAFTISSHLYHLPHCPTVSTSIPTITTGDMVAIIIIIIIIDLNRGFSLCWTQPSTSIYNHCLSSISFSQSGVGGSIISPMLPIRKLRLRDVT